MKIPSLYTIPPGIGFADALAGWAMDQAGGDPLALSRMRMLLPTRRAARTMRDAFLKLSNGRPLLLPSLQTIGDVDEDELLLEGGLPVEAVMGLPPAMPALRRRMILARAILKMEGFAHGPAQALELAATLARLMDQAYTEGLSLSALPDLVDRDEFAQHWRITTDFLSILSRYWPDILAEHGMIDDAERRNLLIRALAQHWRDQPPAYPVIAAGSTGSIPATAALLEVIAHLPQGYVVLPGLDLALDEASWDALDDSHPQAALRHLLENLGVSRADIRPFPFKTEGEKISHARALLAGELMRPAATSDQWRALAGRGGEFAPALQGLTVQSCETVEEEARVIALIFRHTLEQAGRTAALITPDRQLARRVAAFCRRWNIQVNDTGGQMLGDMKVGIFLRLSLQAGLDHFAPGALLSVLRHGLCRAGMARGMRERAVSMLETYFLRGPKPPPGMEGLRNHIELKCGEAAGAGHETRLRMLEAAQAASAPLLEALANAYAPLMPLCDGQAHDFNDWLSAHIKVAEALAAMPEETGAARLWRGEDGEEAARFFAKLMEEGAALPPMDGADYASVLEGLLGDITVRARYGTHPRLHIMGQLEARMAQADIIIMGGLNESVWPPDPGHDPWMSRPMRKKFGLPAPERAIALAAHDFVQLFCAPRVVLTRSLRRDGAPTVPARWLQRLNTVLQALDIDPATLAQDHVNWRALARNMDESAQTRAIPRPAPTPPVKFRPMMLPVTQIETWLRDPYAVYARYILRLRKLDPLERAPDTAMRGTFLHDVLNEFIALYGEGPLPENAADLLIDLGLRKLKSMSGGEEYWQYWQPRFERIARWMAEHEAQWRAYAAPLRTEYEGRATIPTSAGAFTLTARADRIDRMRDGTLALIDYKSGGTYTKARMKNGDSPQLPLEALIAREGGFADLGTRTGYIGYWKMSGGAKEGEIIALDDEAEIADAAQKTYEALVQLVEAFAEEDTPYLCQPRPERAPRFNDYRHLSRIQEWSVESEMEEDS